MANAVWIPTNTSGSFSDGSNWLTGNPSPGPAPGPGDSATIEAEISSLDIQGSGSVETLYALGDTYFDAAVIFDGANITATYAALEVDVTLDAGAILTATSLFTNTGTVEIDAGANLTATSNADLDANEDINGGTLTLQNNSVLEANNTLSIPNDGSVIGPSSGAGVFSTEASTSIDVDSGSLTSNNFFVVGSLTMEDGLITVTVLTFAAGTGSALSSITGGDINSGTLVVGGQSNTTTLSVTDATVDASDDFGIGGDGGSGFVTVNAGGSIQSGAMALGEYANGAGTLLVESGGADVNVTGEAEIGVAGDGAVTVAVDGLFSSDDLDVGSEGNGFGSLEINTYGEAEATSTTIGVQGAVYMEAGTLDTTALTVSGKIVGIGTVAIDDGNGSVILDGGGILAEYGTLEIDGGIGGSGAVTVQSNTVLQLDQGVVSGQAISFSGGEVILKAPTQVQGTFAGFGAGDTILASGIVANTPSFTGGALTLFNGATPVLTLNVSGSFTSSNFALAQTGGGTAITYQVACYAAGTRIAVPRGWRAVEDLMAGDHVVLAHGGTAPITWVGHRALDCRRHPEPAAVWPVRVKAGAFAPERPSRDLFLSPDHAVFVDGGLIPIRCLVNGGSIARVAVDRVVYYHIELEKHHILLAEDLPAESWLDTGNRDMFDNGATVRLHPMFKGPKSWRDDAAAPLITDAIRVRPVWERLAARSAALGLASAGGSATTDPALRLSCGDRTFWPVERHGDRYRFIVPPSPGPIRLVTRSGRAADVSPWVDDRRRLGVAVSCIRWRDRDGWHDLPVDHPALTDGWWMPERDGDALHRWTAGAAVLPVPFPASPMMVEIRLAGGIAYLEDPAAAPAVRSAAA
jgi:hypothetical protein